jgi:hypothetical protein
MPPGSDCSRAGRRCRWTVRHPPGTAFADSGGVLPVDETDRGAPNDKMEVTDSSDTRSEEGNTSNMQPGHNTLENINASHKRKSHEHAVNGVEENTAPAKLLKLTSRADSTSLSQPDVASDMSSQAVGAKFDLLISSISSNANMATAQFKVLQQKAKSSEISLPPGTMKIGP